MNDQDSVMQTPETLPAFKPSPTVIVSGLVLAGVFVWAYTPSMLMLVERWWNEPDYIYGFLVPVFSVFLLWERRELLNGVVPKGSLWGLAFIAIACVLRLESAYLFFRLLDPLSMIPCIAGIVLFIGGWQVLRWAAPSIVFLLFMIPLPGHISGLLGNQLQHIATTISVFTLQTIGIPAVAQGTVIQLSETTLGVVEACSGIRMLMLFFTACVGAALIMKRPMLEKIIMVASAVPIAVFANVFRITLTAFLYEKASRELGDALFHDAAGWIMMPLALALIALELLLLSKLFIRNEEFPLAVGRMRDKVSNYDYVRDFTEH